MIMKIREPKKNPISSYIKKEDMFTRRDANTYCPFFQSSMQTMTFYAHIS